MQNMTNDIWRYKGFISDDICGRKHGGNPESEAANRQTNKERSRAICLAMIRLSAMAGITCDEIQEATGMLTQTASARCSELLRDGLITRHVLPDGTNLRRRTRNGSMAAVLFPIERQSEFPLWQNE